MRFPALLINLKVYKEGLDSRIAHIAKEVANETGVEIILCPSHILLKEISQIIPTFAQSIDPVGEGAYTGAITAGFVKHAGALGTLISHSEKCMPMDNIKTCIDECKSVGLLSCVCVANESEAEEIVRMRPDIILIEPPQLVGGNVSVSTAEPELVRNSIDTVKHISSEIKVLCGAGVKDQNDVKRSLELGADGVAVSSGIVKAPNVEKAIYDIVDGFSQRHAK